MDIRRVAAILAAVGAGLWLTNALVLLARDGEYPNPQIESVTFAVGFALLILAAGLVGWSATATRSPLVRAALVALAVLAVPITLLVGQVSMFAVPGSHWLESDAIVILLAVLGLGWALRELSPGRP